MKKPLSVLWLGLRGFPNVEGGIETHAEHICTNLVQLGCDVHVFTRSAYQPHLVGDAWQGVQLHRLGGSRLQGIEALLHTFWGVLYAGFILRPDILHIQAIGPAIMTPLARLLGLKVVVTHHGPDYERQKWGNIAKFILQLGERLGMNWAHQRIVISAITQHIVLNRYGLSSILIPNGVAVYGRTTTQATIEQYHLQAERYILLVSRLVPEKRHADLIKAFQAAALSDWKLVIVGSIGHPNAYVKEVLALAANTPNVVCTGFLSGQALAEIYTHAGLFVLPSSHEGLSITLLEALGYGLPVLVSDIPANLEIGLTTEHYFPLGDRSALAAKMRLFANIPITSAAREERMAWVRQRYNWQDISERTLAIYRTIT